MKARRFAWLLTGLVGVGGCSDALVFGDRSSIEVASLRLNDDVAEPIRVNIGLDRQLVTNAPALGGTVASDDGKKRVASGEAINLFSSFRAGIEPSFAGGETSDPGGGLRVRTRFASGAAALEVAEAPELAAAFLGISTFGRDTTSDQLEALFDADPKALDRTRAILATQSPPVSVTSMLNGSQYTSLRREILTQLNQ